MEGQKLKGIQGNSWEPKKLKGTHGKPRNTRELIGPHRNPWEPKELKGTQENSWEHMGTHGNPWEQKEQNNPQKGEKSKTKKRSRALKNAGKQWNQCNLAITQKRHKSYIFVTKQGTM